MNNINFVKVLLIEDNPVEARLISELLKESETMRLQVQIADRISNAKDFLSKEIFDIMLLDLSLPDATNLNGLKELSNIFPTVAIIILTGNENLEIYRNAVKEGAQDFLPKNKITTEALNRSIYYALERCKIQNKLAKSERDWQNIFQAIPHPTVILDSEYNIIALNKVIETKTGKSAEELKTKKCWQIFHGENTTEPPCDCPFQSVSAMNNDGIFEKEMQAFGGTYLVSCKLVKDKDGKLEHVIHIATDITERVEMLREKTALNKILSEKTKELEQLISIAGHDMRSPLVNIQGFSEITLASLDKLKENIISNKLDDENVKEFLKGEVHESLEFVISSSKKINRIIEGLLGVSRLGRSVPHIGKLNMKNLIKEILISFKFIINENNVQINLHELPYCMGDKQMIQRLFSDLIENAIKFKKPEQPCIIDISAEGETENPIYIIKDNGRGISYRFREKIFTIFQRADLQKPGEGLGLAFAKKIVEKHDGEIWFESVENEGTTFFVKLKGTL